MLSDYGYDADRIADERAKIEDFDQANQAQEMAKGASQQASQEQEEALKALNDWVAQYLKIAKVALRGKKQLLGANADRRDCAHDEDGSSAGCAQEGGDESCEEGVGREGPWRLYQASQPRPAITSIDDEAVPAGQ